MQGHITILEVPYLKKATRREMTLTYIIHRAIIDYSDTGFSGSNDFVTI
jgi:hypothetical protein